MVRRAIGVIGIVGTACRLNFNEIEPVDGSSEDTPAACGERVTISDVVVAAPRLSATTSGTRIGVGWIAGDGTVGAAAARVENGQLMRDPLPVVMADPGPWDVIALGGNGSAILGAGTSNQITYGQIFDGATGQALSAISSASGVHGTRLCKA